MEFNLPTSKTQMYELLNEIYHYYRIRRATFEDIKMQQLELDRMSFSILTPEEISARAEILVESEIEKEKNKDQMSIRARMASISKEIDALNTEKESVTGEAEELFEKSKTELENKAFKNGLVSSGILFEKMAQLESDKNQQILTVLANYDDKIASLRAEYSAQNYLLEELNTFYAGLKEKRIAEKVLELNEQMKEDEQEVFKYNNGIEEKKQRYANTIIQANANLELKFLEISSGEFSKSQLVEMGYYEDIMRCVCGYYDVLNAVNAYQDIINEQKLSIYLDDYYESLVYMYKMRAGY